MKSGWASKVQRQDIISLYARDAEGIYDEDLINEVGFGLLAKCEESLTAGNWHKQLCCPNCRTTLDEVPCAQKYPDRPTSCAYQCPACGWEGGYKQYVDALRRNTSIVLRAPCGLLPTIRKFVDEFPVARTPQERMVMIDTLLHGYHGMSRAKPGTGTFIEGTTEEVIALLDGISQGKWAFHRSQCPRCGTPLFGRRPMWRWGTYCSKWCHNGTSRSRELRRKSREHRRRELRRREIRRRREHSS